MIKKLLSICCIAILITSINGCSEKNVANKATNEVQQNISQDNSTDEEKAASVSNKDEANSVSNKNEELPDYFTQKDKILLIGKINNKLDIHMELQITNKKSFDDIGERSLDANESMSGEQPEILYEGSYYYDQYKKNIRIEAEAYSNGYFSIYEFDENNKYSGSFRGFLEHGNILKGTWANHEGTTYQFYLVESNSKIDELNLDVDTNKIGDYCTKGSNEDDYYIYLYIVATSDDKFKFHISGYSKPNIGNVGGVAYYTDESKREATFYDGRNCKINFNFVDDKTIKVSATGIEDYAGAHVTMVGTFEKKNLK